LRWLGTVAITRKDTTPEAIRLLPEAGLRIIMPNGDSRPTVEAAVGETLVAGLP